MGKALIGGGYSGGPFSGTAFTYYLGDLGGLVTEGFAQITMRNAGTMSNLGGSVDNVGTGRSNTNRKNGSPVNLTVSFTDTTAQIVYDTTHSDSYSAGDLHGSRNVETGTTTWYWLKAVWEGSSGHNSPYATQLCFPHTGTFFSPLSGGAAGTDQSSTETSAQALMRTSGTIKNVAFHVFGDGTSSMVMTLRKNVNNGNITATCPANTTGTFEDTSHTDTFADGDLISLRTTNQSVIASTQFWISSHIDYDANENEIFSHLIGAIAFNASDRFLALLGTHAPTTTEAPWKIKHHFAGKARNLRAHVSSYSMGSAFTLRLRKNGADANQQLSITGTGWFEDTSNNDSFLATDDLNYVIRGGTSGSATFGPIMMTESSSVALTATGLTVGSPVFGTPTYTKNSINLTALMPSWSPDIGSPEFTQKHALLKANLTVGSPVIQIPGLVGFGAVGVAVASPEIGRPRLKHPFGPWAMIPTHSSQLAEADAILNRALDALIGAVPGRQVGRPAWDFRRAVGAIRADGKTLINDGTLGPKAAEAWALARAAGATFEGFMTARARLLAEMPVFVPGEAVAHLTVQLTLVQMAALTASTTYESRDDALFALKRIAVAFEAAEEDVADEHDAMTYRSLVTLRAAAVRDLAERSRQLPRVVPYAFANSMPGLWIAHRIFADGSRAEQLLAENKWVHPAFASPEGICLSR
jgi:hypothetical protein